MKTTRFPCPSHRFNFRAKSHASQEIAIIISECIISECVTQRFTSRLVGVSDGTADLADDLHLSRVLPYFLGPLPHVVGDSTNLIGVRHVDEDTIGYLPGQTTHLRTKRS